MKFNKRVFRRLFLISGVLILSGCATLNQGEYLDEKTIKVERIDSPHAKIGFVSIKKMDKVTWIRGDIKRRVPVRGPIFGHLDVTVTSPDGKTLFKDTVTFKRKSLKSKTAQFLIEIKSPILVGSNVSIKHHYLGSNN